MKQAELDTRDAKRYRALMKHFKSDHIWNHVFFEEDHVIAGPCGGVDDVLDYIAKNGRDYVKE